MLRQIDPILQKTLDSVPKTDTGAIDLTTAKLIAEGGTHLLYRFPDAPFVIKVMRQNPSPAELDALEKKYAVLYDCFDKKGKQRCIREQHITHSIMLPERDQGCDLSLMSVSPLNKMVMALEGPSYILSPEGLYYISDANKQVTKEDLIEANPEKVKALWEKISGSKTPGDRLPEKISTENQQIIKSITNHSAQDAALSFVPYEKCFQAKVKFDFKIEPAELDPYLIDHHQELFTRVNEALITTGNPKADFNASEYAPLDERIGPILQRLDNDPKLKESMIEFLTHYRDFYKRTNIILDAMGYENILFFKDEADDWQFKVGSAIKHDTGKFTNELFDSIRAGNEVNLNEFVNFTHAFFSPANIRAVNVCALKLGLAPVVNNVAIDPKDLIKISQDLSIPERMFAYARHGDFEKMNKMLLENKAELSFDLGSFWTYPLIADEYIKHGQPINALKNYLDIVSEFSITLPENKDQAKRIENTKTSIVDRKKMLDKKIILHDEFRMGVEKGRAKHSDVTAEQMTNSAFGRGSDTAKEKRGKVWGHASEQKQPAQQESKHDPLTTEHQPASPFSSAKKLKPPRFK
jgi:hypothetical protein